MRQRVAVTINLAKAWLLGGPAGFANTSVDLAGFSITLAKKR